MFLNTKWSAHPANPVAILLSGNDMGMGPAMKLSIHLLQLLGISVSSFYTSPSPIPHVHRVFYFLPYPTAEQVVWSEICWEKGQTRIPPKHPYVFMHTHTQTDTQHTILRLQCAFNMCRYLKKAFEVNYFYISQILDAYAYFFPSSEVYFHCFMKDERS